MSLSTHTLQSLLDTWGYLAVLLFVGIESSGIPFPGETMLVVAAVYAGAGHLNVEYVIAFAAIGAILGDNVGYIIGRTGGRALAKRYGHYVGIDEKKLGVAERFFERHGDKTVFFGRFVAVLRAWAAFLAGVNRMPWQKFFFYNAAGGIVWSLTFGVLAFELGRNLSLLDKIIKAFGIVGVVAAVAFILGVVAYHYRERWAWWNESEEQAESTERDDAVGS